jgi:hypothetical protein
MAGGRARHLLWPACHGTRGEWKPCGRLTARQPNFPRPASEYGWSGHPGPGACPPRPRDPVTHADRAAQGYPGASGWPRAQRDCPGDPARFSAVSLPARRRDGRPCPRPRWIRLASPAGRGRSEGAGHWPPRPARRDRSRRSRRGCHSSPGMLTRSNTTSSQSGPARSMTRIRDPTPGTPGHIKSSGRPGKLKGLRRVRANPAAIWMTWRPAASVPAPDSA